MTLNISISEPCLSQMGWSDRFGSLCISQVVKYLLNHPRGVRPENLHVIGYSVGAHIAGLLANYIPVEDGKLGRITGLDPTIFFYTGANHSRGLDPSDANFVDVIHTGAGILGQWRPSGHADFYVNGGTSQPGCASTSLFGEFGDWWPSDQITIIFVSPCRHSGLWSHQRDALLYRVHQQPPRILRRTVSESIVLSTGLVPARGVGVCANGRTLSTQVSWMFIWSGMSFYSLSCLQCTWRVLCNDECRSAIRSGITEAEQSWETGTIRRS